MTLADRATIAQHVPRVRRHRRRSSRSTTRRCATCASPAAPRRRSTWSSATRKEQGLFRTDGDAGAEVHRAARAGSGHGRAEPGRAASARRTASPLAGVKQIAFRRRCSTRQRRAEARALGRAARTSCRSRRTRGRDRTAATARRSRHGVGRDRRDHQLHEHVEPIGHARRRAAGQEGRREGARRSSPYVKTSLAPGLARGDRLPDKRGLDAVPRSARLPRWSATAARPASATAARCRAGRAGGQGRATWSSAAVLSRQSQLRRPHQSARARPTTWPRRRWWSPTRWPARSTST